MTNIDWSECPIVQRNPRKLGGLPTVRDLRLSAGSVVENHDDGVSENDIADMFHVPLDDVRTVLAYAKQARQSAHSVAQTPTSNVTYFR